ncbi:acetyltransferase [Mycobacterium kubicae]|uniref:Lysine N-acyltransferase MbtK n=1 Tax=Mycobacterium kubicae TaxID=120959 RepID=A0AAX1JKC1_9MYCO|nr:acetyltransferase [Mycobacterium kubicae]QNI14887.1 acetyltransferase [Mycobacterium kubicae]QPI40793.1 acetyltransferase [Mycobacterium kubicae]
MALCPRAEVETLDLFDRRAILRGQPFAGEFALRPLDTSHDLDLVHRWMNDPEVARFWRKAWPLDRLATYLREQECSTHVQPYLGEVDGVAMSYWELYRADLDPLAQYYDARRHDAGVHLLLGPTVSRGRGLGTALLRVVSSWQLDADPRASRVVAEPDLSNERSIRAFQQAGFRRIRDLVLPDKLAALMVRERPSH